MGRGVSPYLLPKNSVSTNLSHDSPGTMHNVNRSILGNRFLMPWLFPTSVFYAASPALPCRVVHRRLCHDGALPCGKLVP